MEGVGSGMLLGRRRSMRAGPVLRSIAFRASVRCVWFCVGSERLMRVKALDRKVRGSLVCAPKNLSWGSAEYHVVCEVTRRGVVLSVWCRCRYVWSMGWRRGEKKGCVIEGVAPK